MPFHRLPDELYSRILKEALHMWVEYYGPSDQECLYGISHCLPSSFHPRRVSEVLGLLVMPPLGCAFCEGICRKFLHRTECGMVEWRAVCDACDSE